MEIEEGKTYQLECVFFRIQGVLKMFDSFRIQGTKEKQNDVVLQVRDGSPQCRFLKFWIEDAILESNVLDFSGKVIVSFFQEDDKKRCQRMWYFTAMLVEGSDDDGWAQVRFHPEPTEGYRGVVHSKKG